jgi:hypothetical protein
MPSILCVLSVAYEYDIQLQKHTQTRTQIPFNWTTLPAVTLKCFMLVCLLSTTNKAAAWNYGNTNTKADTKLSNCHPFRPKTIAHLQ